MVFQANRYYGAPQQAHNEHAALTNEKRDQEVARHGDIKPDASGLTKFIRGVKHATSGPLNMLRNLITVGTAIAPVGLLSKLKLGRKVAKSVQTAKSKPASKIDLNDYPGGKIHLGKKQPDLTPYNPTPSNAWRALKQSRIPGSPEALAEKAYQADKVKLSQLSLKIQKLKGNR